LKIARSIEKVFSENLNEFYGTLAYHYEKAENWEKTEEYLVKAGDEAMNTGAYAEAINFYFDVFLKLKNRQDSTSESGKFLEVEEKLSYAYYADGQNVKSAEHFNKVLRSYNLTAMPKGRMLNSLSMIRDMLILRFRIKFWNGKISRENRSEDNKLMKMLLYRNEAIATYSPKEAFIQGMYCISRVPMGVLTGTDYGAGALIELSTVFPWSGRSIGLGRLLNKFAWRIIDRNNTHIWLIYIYVGVMFEYFTDRLIPESEHEKAFKFGMETGQVWAPTIYHSFKCISLVDQGLKEKSENVLKSMKILVTSLENSLSLVQYYRAQQTYLLKFRKLEEVIGNAGEFIGYCVKTDHKTMLLLNYCLASMAFCLKNDIQQAWFFYYKAEELQKTLWLNYYVSITLLTKAFIELGELRSGNKNANGESHIGFSKTTKSLVKASKKVNCTKTEAYRFRALYFQLTGKKKSALKYYSKSIDFAQWYGARLELSRTYFELGKFLSDSKTGKTKFNGLTGEDYLKRAQTMFEETGLEWDLEQYRKYSN
jgi:tetratricopeptide (TPR) repeat protein